MAVSTHLTSIGLKIATHMGQLRMYVPLCDLALIDKLYSIER